MATEHLCKIQKKKFKKTQKKNALKEINQGVFKKIIIPEPAVPANHTQIKAFVSKRWKSTKAKVTTEQSLVINAQHSDERLQTKRKKKK